jgi:hypothetical protein
MFYFYLAIVGLFTFASFIMQESIQMLTFAQFTNAKTERYDLMYDNIKRMEEINSHIRMLNEYFLWLQPFQMVSYGDFADATDEYIKSQLALILANDPGLFVMSSELVAIQFYYKQVLNQQDYYVLRAGKLQYSTTTKPQSNPIYISGKIVKISDYLFEIKDKI